MVEMINKSEYNSKEVVTETSEIPVIRLIKSEVDDNIENTNLV